MKKYQNFLSENFHFLVAKFSIYLNRHVFVMKYLNMSSAAVAIGALRVNEIFKIRKLIYRHMRVVKSRIILVLWRLFGKQENKDTYEMLQS